MKLAFYYHYAVLRRDGALLLPGFLGVFVDSLAAGVESLFLVMHTIEEDQQGIYDYTLKSKNIHCIEIGPRTPAWHRHFFHRKILSAAQTAINTCDVLLVRSPSPLAPFLAKICKSCLPVFLVVGDYAQTAREKKIKGLRDQLILQYNLHFDRIFRKSMRSTDIVVNSPALYRTYESFAKSIFQVRTTTLSAKDIFIRPDVFTGKEIHLLYTGRFDRNKGLFECLEAFRDLFQKHPQMRLNFVGWDASKDQSVLNQLKAKAVEYGVQHQVIFHGKKAVGAELNAVYQQSDIYLLASYHEGFPRTIWEAMANGLPVIATKVGAIPDYLRHEEDAMLIDPRNVSQIVDAVETLLWDELLRKKLIQNGYELAKQNTLEIQSKILLDRLLALKNKQISNEGTTIQ